jgi:DNA polymerase-3 subunit delta
LMFSRIQNPGLHIMALKYQNAKHFKLELDKKKLALRYLFLGEEEGEKDKFIGRIINMMLPEDLERAHSTARFHIENDEFAAAADFALSPTMFSSRRICVMYNIERLQFTKNKIILNDLVSGLPDSTLLIMTSLDNKPPAFLTGDILAAFTVVQFWKYFDKDIYGYIHLSFKKLGLAIEDRAIELLIERTGNDIKKIDDAIEMVRFSGTAGVVDIDTIRNCVDDLRDTSIFEFVDSLFKRQKKSVFLLKKIFEDGIPELKIVYMILREAEMIEQYHLLVENGLNAEDAAIRVGVYSKNRESFRRHAELFSRESIARIYPLISSTEYRLKSGARPDVLTANPVFSLTTDIVFGV